MPHAFAAHAALARRAGDVAIAGGEGAHTVHMATNLIDFGGVRYVQIDAARIGGIAASKAVADHAVARGVTYVNHTFTSHLALSASLQPFAGLEDHRICEYPVDPEAGRAGPVGEPPSARCERRDPRPGRTGPGDRRGPRRPGAVPPDGRDPGRRHDRLHQPRPPAGARDGLACPRPQARTARFIRPPARGSSSRRPSTADRADGSRPAMGYAMRGLQGRVINAVGSQIVAGRFAPGDVLPTEAELTAEHRVSRTPVREAMRGPGGEGHGRVPAEARHARAGRASSGTCSTRTSCAGTRSRGW